MGLFRFIFDGIIDYGAEQGIPDAIEFQKRRKIERQKKKKKTRVSEQDGDLETWVASLDE